ncbi:MULTISPECIES: trypsin-like serine protease [unclassified Streptomyces]|uniref:trypsin-like serine protease n=1 Tax=unclassified Streptomyces TaxID=2593676 RepID=UPI001BECE8CB|nr:MULTISPECIES: trypsin-like serine protease [unclassified Streptomyces]MBT2406522.1 S1 family peptidase [Streptomyces sp. ISL-21]MBT2459829.1 S1 family peptidase [Streptomyces sp. ISL-86]MBT2608860.1 S1 family peptidase [Streptomyces sp. ISL-87]
MLATRPRPARITGLLVSATAVSAGLSSSGPALAVTGPEAAAGQYAYVARLNIGDEANSRGCTGTLIDEWWIASASSCFATTPGQQVPAGKPALKTTATLSNGQAVDVVDVVPRTDRDLVLARLAIPATGITGVKRATAATAAGTDLTAVGFGRTKTEWVPGKLHTGTFTTNTVDAATLAVTGKGTDAICKGDTGGPLLNAAGELVGVNSRSWQGGCLGTDAAETRTGAISARADDLGQWIQDVRALTPGWKTEAVVQAGTSLYQGIRLADGSWTGFADVQTKAGNINGVRTASVAGINGDTHVVALDGNGRIQHTIRKADGSWGTFGDVGAAAGVLRNVTQVSAVSIGTDLHVVAVSDGKVFHTLRRADGNWTPFGDVSAAASPISSVTSVATANAGGQLQVVAVTGGKAFHTLRDTTGHWTVFGDVSKAAGVTGPITSVAMAGVGTDAHIVIATDNGTHQYHAIRTGAGNWTVFGDLTGYLGNVTAKSVAAGSVNGELQVAVTTGDNRVLHTIRRADRTWSTTTPVALQGITGPPGAIAIAGTL